MGIKRIIQKSIGNENIRKIKGTIQYLKNIPYLIVNKRIKTKSGIKTETFQLRRKNVFCGYYDLNPIKNEKMLVHVTNKKDITSKNRIELGYFDLKNNKYIKIETTRSMVLATRKQITMVK